MKIYLRHEIFPLLRLPLLLGCRKAVSRSATFVGRRARKEDARDDPTNNHAYTLEGMLDPLWEFAVHVAKSLSDEEVASLSFYLAPLHTMTITYTPSKVFVQGGFEAAARPILLDRNSKLAENTQWFEEAADVCLGICVGEHLVQFNLLWQGAEHAVTKSLRLPLTCTCAETKGTLIDTSMAFTASNRQPKISLLGKEIEDEELLVLLYLSQDVANVQTKGFRRGPHNPYNTRTRMPFEVRVCGESVLIVRDANGHTIRIRTAHQALVTSEVKRSRAIT